MYVQLSELHAQQRSKTSQTSAYTTGCIMQKKTHKNRGFETKTLTFIKGNEGFVQ